MQLNERTQRIYALGVALAVHFGQQIHVSDLREVCQQRGDGVRPPGDLITSLRNESIHA